MKPPVAIIYRWRKTYDGSSKLEFSERMETMVPIALKMGWFLLAKDSDVIDTVPETSDDGA